MHARGRTRRLGYPGHHVYNTLLEQHLYLGRGQVEYCVYPLFSPQSLIAEGSANYGIAMCFPSVAERAAFEAGVLFPLAGLDPASAADYYRVEDVVRPRGRGGGERACIRRVPVLVRRTRLMRTARACVQRGERAMRFRGRWASRGQVHRLSYAGNEAARAYVNGELGLDATIDWLVRYALMTPDRARQRVAFFEKYRYVLARRPRARTLRGARVG